MGELEKKLKNIEKIFDVEELLEEQNSQSIIKSYYKINKLAYRVFHNRKGYLHMGISNGGEYTHEDLEVPLFQIEEVIKERGVTNVLELASGHGANTVFLAKRNSNIKFYATDLSTKPKREFYKLKNTFFEFGDYHDLSQYKSGFFDVIFIMEALCHSDNKGRVLNEMFRVLKSEGKVIIYDGYFGKAFEKLSGPEKIASKLTSRGMAVAEFGDLKKVENQINQAGFEVVEKKSLSKEVYPTMVRFERMSSIFFENKFFGKVIKTFVPEKFVRNSISGYLMPTLLQNGVAVYYRHILERK
jgi:ubiquinone/menaquinone biosynthesis C-methylase UbiE